MSAREFGAQLRERIAFQPPGVGAELVLRHFARVLLVFGGEAFRHGRAQGEKADQGIRIGGSATIQHHDCGIGGYTFEHLDVAEIDQCANPRVAEQWRRSGSPEPVLKKVDEEI